MLLYLEVGTVFLIFMLFIFQYFNERNKINIIARQVQNL